MNREKKLPASKDKSAINESFGHDPIAVIGIGCRYPGAANPEELWSSLLAGKDAVGPYPGHRFAELDGFYERARSGQGLLSTDRGGFLANIDGFDSQFFEISPRESMYVDPQHRLLLEVALDALEDAGQVREAYEGSATGVYVGLWTNEYEARLYQSATENDFYSVTGCGRASGSGRLSFTFGFQGPSVTIDTACSSSLVAVHMACQGLWNGEIDMALAGGANVILGTEISELFTKANMLSPEGRCKFGDASADGFVRSEGAGIVVLKRLSQAIADKDPMYAVVRGSAVNNDGRSSGLLVTPSRIGQQEMLRAAWQSAGVEPKNIRYIEMHGTGTSVGDPVEIEAVGGALADAGVTALCALGSIKTNIGHTETAAGVAGLIKVALALKHRVIPPSLYFETRNPKIAWDKFPVRVVTEPVDLSSEAGLILAGVNSFGLSGTNAHVVMEEVHRQPYKTPQGSGPYLLPVSARSPEALDAMLRAHLEQIRSLGTDYPVRDSCYMASVRRNHHEYRAAIAGEDRKELENNLAAAVAREDCEGVVVGRVGAGKQRIVFVAPGQGSQWLGMARELFDNDSVFRQAFEECDSAIAAETGWRLTDRVLGAEAEHYISQIDVIQPALFTMSVALAAVWRSWGIQPDAVVGHSMGEVAAAHIAGILSLQDAAAVICRRSRWMKTLSSSGSMATVELPLREVEALLQPTDGALSVAASNGPHTTVISGDAKALEELLHELEAREIYCRQIKVDVASHSAQVDPILEALFTSLSDVAPQPAQVPMLSTVTGEYASESSGTSIRTATRMDAEYWVRNLRRCVLFAPAIQKLCLGPHNVFIELSPHPILLPSIESSAREVDPAAMAVASLRREKPARATMLRGLAELYAAGQKIEWTRLYPEEVRCVRLPQYQFQRERSWPDPSERVRPQISLYAGQTSPLLGRRFESSLQPHTLLWEANLDIATLPYLNDHRVLRSAVFPAAGYIEMAFSAAKAMRPAELFEVCDALFLNAAYIPDTGPKSFQLALTPDGSGAYSYEIRSRGEQAEATWMLHASGILKQVETDSNDLKTGPQAVPISDLQERYQTHRDSQDHYARTLKSGLQYGPAFQLVEEVWVGHDESLCRLRSRPSGGKQQGGKQYVIHPAVLDACFQAMAHVRPALDAFQAEDTYLPVAIEQVQIYRAIPEGRDLFANATLASADPLKGTFRVDMRLLDADGSVLMDVRGMEVKRVAREDQSNTIGALFSLEWIEEKMQGNGEATLALLPNVPSENWVIFADRTGVAEAIQESLEFAGGRCTLVRPGANFGKLNEAEFAINPGTQKDLERLFDEIAISSGVPTAVVHLWTLDNNMSDVYDAESLILAQANGSQSVPGIVQAITGANWQNPPRLWLATGGAMSVCLSDGHPHIESAPMWGIGRTVVREHPELRATLVDLSAIPDLQEARGLALLICSDGKEDRIALRGVTKYVQRLIHFSKTPPEVTANQLAVGEDYRVEIPATGILDNLELRACSHSTPAAGDVAIKVIAAGLNFIDVTKVMGIYPGLDPSDPLRLGIECAGRVTAIGEGVSGFQIGEEVVAVTPSMRTTAMMASAVSVPAAMVLHKPSALSMEEAATTPIAFLTAYYSLVELARIRRGDWVLIHAAAGGVGLAAIEIAKWAGANIIATVGSSEKEDYVRSLGITHVFNSRSLTFADGVMEATEGRGVDIVLNSLTGEFLSKSLELLAPYGRFVELGKRDIYDDRQLGLKVFRKNLSFHAVDLAAAMEERRPYVVELLREVMRHIGSGEWRSLPVQSFSASEPSVPFRFMAQARHIGKIAIAMDRDVRVLPATERPLFTANATYLITGGLGGVALTVAEWMVQNGAGHLVLLSRRAPSEEAAKVVRKMEKHGAVVTTVPADVTQPADLEKVLRKIHATGFPLKGIMHAAAVVDDALIMDLSPERFLPVMGPKIAGTWNLHTMTLEEDLDFFVLFSSIAAIHPQPGMGSYAAANAFLDSFAQYRRSLGKPATSVNWGGWDQIGLARAVGTGRSIEGYEQQGMRNFSGPGALAALGRALETNPVQVIAVPFDWEKFAEFHGPNGAPPVFSGLVAQTEAAVGAQSSRSEILEQLVTADSAKQRHEILESYLQEVLGRVLKLATRKIDRERPLGSMGLDSLMGLEFVRRLSSALQVAVPATVVFNYPTIKLMATHLLGRLQLGPSQEAAASAEKFVNTQMLHGKDEVVHGLFDDLSEEDALQALMGTERRSS